MKALVKITALVVVAALTVGVAATPAAAEPDMRQLAERLLEEQSNQAEQPNQKGKRCVAGTAPAGNTPAGTCSSPYDPPPNLQAECSYKLVEIVTLVWVPPVIRWVPKVVSWLSRIIGGIKVSTPVTKTVAEVVEVGYWDRVSTWVQERWCP